jgi:hypothetical protein
LAKSKKSAIGFGPFVDVCAEAGAPSEAIRYGTEGFVERIRTGTVWDVLTYRSLSYLYCVPILWGVPVLRRYEVLLAVRLCRYCKSIFAAHLA